VEVEVMFKARPINFRRKEGQNELEAFFTFSQVGPLSWVARFSDDYLKNSFPEFLTEAMGYRFLYQESVFLVSCYARPWWVWRLLKWFPGLCGG
jgi:hypothetical protein